MVTNNRALVKTFIAVILSAALPGAAFAKKEKKAVEVPAMKYTAEQQKRIDAGLRIKAGTELSIVAYDKALKIFTLQIASEPDNGPNYVAVDSFIKSIGDKEQSHMIERDPATGVDTIFHPKNDVWLIDATEFEARKAELKKAKAQGR